MTIKDVFGRDPFPFLGGPRGWTCPKCGRVYARAMLTCWHCNSEIDRVVAVPGFTLVRYTILDGQGSHVEQVAIFTDGHNFDDVRNSRRVVEWDERHYSFKDGRWTED